MVFGSMGATTPANAPEKGEGDGPESDDGEGIAADGELFAGLLSETTDQVLGLESEWLYQLDGEVFGPLKSKALLELLYEGTIGAETLIAAEEGDYRALRLFGAFRSHLSRAKEHQERVAREHAARSKATRSWRLRVLRFVAAAVALLGICSLGVFWWQSWRAEVELAEVKAKEAALKKELDGLLARVTIQPPLMPLVEPKTPVKETRQTKKKPKRRRAFARFSGKSELSKREIMQGVGRAFGGFKRCIVAQIQRDPDSVPEQLLLSFSISNGGIPRNIRLANRALRGSPLAACMKRKLGAVRWRKYRGEVRNVEYPITVRGR